MHPCLPSKSKCEWSELEPFVNCFNEINKTHYVLKECCDIVKRDTPQPEVLLEDETIDPSDGKRLMVIEKKNLVLPKSIENHNKEHKFMDAFMKMANKEFDGEDAYLLSVKVDTNHSYEKLVGFAKDILQSVVAQKEILSHGKGLHSCKPFPWTFKKLSELEKDDYGNRTGIGVELKEILDLSFSNYNEELEEIKKILVKNLCAAEKKFTEFTTALKVVVLPSYIELLTEDVLTELLNSIQVPDSIDQVWLEDVEYVNDFCTEANFKQVY